MKSTYLTLTLFVIIIAAVGLLTLNYPSAEPNPNRESTTTNRFSLQATATPATSTKNNNRLTTAPTSSASSTPNPNQSSAKYARVAPEEATHIEVVDGCDHNYQGGCLNVRSQPTTSSSVVTQLRDGIVLKVAAVEQHGNRTWYRTEFDEWLRYPDRVSGEWWIAGDFVRPLQATATSTETPGQIETNKRIVVDLSEQKLYAYEGEEIFMEESVSTGKQFYPTPRGTFPIYKMTPTRYMQGPIEGITDQEYDLPGVPWDLYFTYQGAVIHGAYWHDHFGEAWSNGCVNLPPAEAERLYRWAELGTKVVVQD